MQNRERVARRSNAVMIAVVIFLLAYASMTFFTAPARAQTANSDHPILTAAEFKKLSLYVDKDGSDWTLSTRITQLLGLSKPGETMTVRQLNASESADSIQSHVFNRDKANQNIIIFMYSDPSKNLVRGYVTDSSLTYITGYVSQNGINDIIPVQDGEIGLAAEIRWWAGQMDTAPNP